jgi:cytochrome c biogenesis protein CcmG, thiol:disulfide interchange protein DsbE
MIERRVKPLGWPLVFVLLALAGLLLAGDSYSVRQEARATSVAVGRPAPDALVWTSEGISAHLSLFRGRPIWLNFFTSWCRPCKEEMTQIERRYVRYQGVGLIVVGVDEQESHSQIASFAQTLRLTFPIVFDDGSAADAYQVRGLPMSVFVDSRGVVQETFAGAMSDDDMDRALGTILR